MTTRGRFYRWATITLVCAGVLARGWYWWRAGSLSYDELFIALNLRDRAFGQLRGVLDYGQMAPLGWLWTEKLALLAFGRGEAGLRLSALVAGCATLPVFAWVARRILSAPLALVALALVAGAPQLLYFSMQAKQYAWEVLAATALVALALRLRDTGTDTSAQARAIAAFWGVAAVGVWFATTVAVAAVAIGGVLAVHLLVSRSWSALRWHACGATVMLGSALALAALQRPHVTQSLYSWWEEHYPGSLAPQSLGALDWLVWSGHTLAAFAQSTLGVARWAAVPIVLLGAVGAIAMLYRRPLVAATVCSPLLAAYLLALARLYPFAQRLALWVAPMAVILLCAAVDHLLHVSRQRRHAWSVGALVLCACLMAGAFLPSVGGLLPHRPAERYAWAENAVRHIAESRQPADRVYFLRSTIPVARWYGPPTDLRWDGAYELGRGADCIAGRGAATDHASGRRVWLVLRGSPELGIDDLRVVRRVAASYGRLLSERSFGWLTVMSVRVTRVPVAPATCLLIYPRALSAGVG